MKYLSSLIFVFIGGGLGSCLRFSLSLVFSRLTLATWKATLIVNVIGALVIHLLTYKLSLNTTQNLLIKTGLLGGLTTFSTFSLEVLTSFKSGNYMEAGIIFLLNIVFGIVISIFIFR